MGAGRDDTTSTGGHAGVMWPFSPRGASFLTLVVVLSLLALVTAGRCRRRRRKARDPLRRVFGVSELRELDAHLNQIAVDELSRMARDLVLYVAGDVGHVVVISDHPRHVMALWLSDGRLLIVSGVTNVTRSLLQLRAATDKIRPVRVEQDGYAYRLLFRGESGSEMRIRTPMVSLTH